METVFAIIGVISLFVLVIWLGCKGIDYQLREEDKKQDLHDQVMRNKQSILALISRIEALESTPKKKR